MGEYEARYGQSHALVIGIDFYQDTHFSLLTKAEAGAEALADTLESAPHNFEVKTLIGKQATREAILSAVDSLRDVGRDDRVLVYFAGHGYMHTDRAGSETGYLAAGDTVWNRDASAVSLRDLTRLGVYSRAKHVGFIFDACFTGQALGLTRTISNLPAEAFLRRRATQAISAGGCDPMAARPRTLVDLLIKALSCGGNVNGDRVYTFSDLGVYLQNTLSTDTGRAQIPQFGHLPVSEGGDFIFFIPEEGISAGISADVAPVSFLGSAQETMTSGPSTVSITLSPFPKLNTPTPRIEPKDSRWWWLAAAVSGLIGIAVLTAATLSQTVIR